MQLPVRQPVAGRRRTSITRASGGVSVLRLLAAGVLLAASGAFYWLTTDETFAVDPGEVAIAGLTYTDAGVARHALRLDTGERPNLFRVRTDDLERALRSLPAVLHASVTAELPDRLRVEVEERRPILAWRAGGSEFLVDAEGWLFAERPGEAAAGEPVPTIEDRRATSTATTVGARLDPLDLRVVRLLGAVTPATLASSSSELELHVDDSDGYVLAAPGAWRAIFGVYTPELRTPELIDDQVQCLRALLEGREATIETVYLAPTAERCGTFRPVGSPEPSPRRPGSSAPSETATPETTP
jgi:cell division septal protein FtsQ